ncbi:AMP-dependent synthetase/ligase [Adhaeretor mobilis]|uniref:Long-chain-fatty-acid--CoA ligase FadD15 n=1 Tax=Adhaeretor mobilis TaxID=1930276 RepID=A0A517MRN4_9BACT|nr:AMP-dependent synthetase/ligase [Adhaeretor mobilis]QDS97534.1 Long-chain-fatty-acid--CoA ligase FadD15 [Adhaeretor mobilis]
MPQFLYERCAQSDEPALTTIAKGKLHSYSWQQVAEDVLRWTAALTELGFGRGQRVALIGSNSYHWILADLSLQLCGAVSVPLHTSLSIEQIVGRIEHAQVSLILADSPRVTSEIGEETSIENFTFEEMHTRAGQGTVDTSHVSQWIEHSDREALTTILYTSGTSGEPRGVMLSHQNLVSNAVAVSDAVASAELETRLAFLPFSHIYARTCDLGSWLYRGTHLVLAESRDTILRDCLLVKPTTLNGVPYFYQKVADGLRVPSTSGTPGRSATHSRGSHLDQKLPPEQDLRAVFGGSIRRLSCGGAGVAPEIEQFFSDRGLPIHSGYGLTEASPVITATPSDGYVPGTVGRPIPGVEVRLADDGEILVRSPGVMMGYWQDKAATSEAIQDGWLHTGDLGQWRDENLRISGRKKEIIVLTTGKKIAPTSIEQRLTGSPVIEQACVFGTGQKYVTAIIVPNPDRLKEEIRRQRLWVWSKHRAVTHPKIHAWFREEIERCLTSVAHHEKIARFAIIPRGFSQELGEMTPKLSLRRQTIEENFQKEIEAMYK